MTRAEMAKMLCVAINGGVDPVLGVKDTPTFTDIKGTWAESYIEYCAANGIIAGRGNNKFDPTGTVSATEAAKMLLGVLGYNAEKSGWWATTGPSTPTCWPTRTVLQEPGQSEPPTPC